MVFEHGVGVHATEHVGGVHRTVCGKPINTGWSVARGIVSAGYLRDRADTCSECRRELNRRVNETG